LGLEIQPGPPGEKLPLSQLVPDWNRDWWALLPPPSANPNRLLIVDRKVPTPDLDSGSYRMSKLIDCCIREGIEIDFVGDCEAEQGRYAKELESKGVSRILIGRRAALNHLTKYGMQYQAAILSRPEVAEKYLPLVRAFAVNAKILYDTVDLHWVRLERESRLSGEVDQFETKTEYHKRLELTNARAADVTIAITEEEKAQLLAEAPNLTVGVLPNIHHPADWVPPFGGRRDLLFVGAFGHPPNVDAMPFFCHGYCP
jgi:hypothetical protein